MVQLYRQQDYIEEYAVLPASERRQLIGGQSNTLRGRNLSGYQVVIPDDIRVTGAYIAICDDAIRALPHIEHKINSSDINQLTDLIPFARSRELIITRRVIKMLLKSNPDHVAQFIAALPDDQLELVVRAVVDTDPSLKSLFPQAVERLLQARESRSL